eukprot:scaffold14470_cov107-Isochrysis_galbana.AAC.2
MVINAGMALEGRAGGSGEPDMPSTCEGQLLANEEPSSTISQLCSADVIVASEADAAPPPLGADDRARVPGNILELNPEAEFDPERVAPDVVTEGCLPADPDAPDPSEHLSCPLSGKSRRAAGTRSLIRAFNAAK